MLTATNDHCVVFVGGMGPGYNFLVIGAESLRELCLDHRPWLHDQDGRCTLFWGESVDRTVPREFVL